MARILKCGIGLFLVLSLAAFAAPEPRRAREAGSSSHPCCVIRSLISSLGCPQQMVETEDPSILSLLSACAVLHGLTASFCGDSVVCGG